MELAKSFTTIICHRTRKELNLTCNEYCICDLVHWESEVEQNKGWCLLSRSEIADMMGISKQAAIKLIEKLVATGLLEKHIDGTLRVTTVWNEKFDQKADQPSVENKNVSTFAGIWTPSF
jgi:DNA-binding MarR family transcriptional regulator